MTTCYFKKKVLKEELIFKVKEMFRNKNDQENSASSKNNFYFRA